MLFRSDYHGTDGELCVSDPQETYAIADAFIAAAEACGYRQTGAIAYERTGR